MLRKPKPHELNGLSEIMKEAEDSSKQRGLAMRKLVRTLENIKAKQNEDDLRQLEHYARKSGAF